MQNDPHPEVGILLDDCTRLLHLARVVARQPPAEEERRAELGRALARISEALVSLAILSDEEELPPHALHAESVGGIVSRILGRGGRRRIGEQIASMRQRADEVEEGGELLQGHSRTVPIPDLLSFLQMQGKTGVLRVVLPEEVISIQFERGDLVAAISSNSPPGCLLGELLVERGALHPRQLHAFLAYFTREHGPIGTALEVHDLVTEEQLRDALTTQIQLLFHRLLAADEALFEFRDGEAEELHPETRLNVTSLLLESARYVDERRFRETPLSATDPETDDPFQELRDEIRSRLEHGWD